MLKQKGFNMIELGVVMAIVGIVSAIAYPSFQNMIGNTQTRTVAESFVSGLQTARLEAVKRGQQIKFSVNPTDYSWQVGCVTPTTVCPAIIMEKSSKEGSGSNVTVTPTGGNDAVFTSFGTLSSSANQLTKLAVINTSVSTQNAKKLSILLGVGGNARMCDEDITTANDPRKC